MHLVSCLDVCPQGTFGQAGSEDSKHIQFCQPCPQVSAQCDSMDHCTECLGVVQLQTGNVLFPAMMGNAHKLSSFLFCSYLMISLFVLGITVIVEFVCAATAVVRRVADR